MQPILITTKTNVWYTEGVVTDVKSDIENLVSGKYQITLLCPDPLLYKPVSSSNTNIYNSKSFSIQDGAGTTTIDSVSAVDTYPVIAWNGQIQGFSITNTTTGKVFAVDDNVPSGNTVIDFKKRTIMVGDICYNSHRLVDSEWWPLVPGENVLEFSNTSGNNNSGSIRWIREARAGI